MWNPEKHIKKMKPHTDKLVCDLMLKGIKTQLNDGNNKNVVLTKGDKTLKIMHHCFYRFSGIACMPKYIGKSTEFKFVEVTDSMFMNEYLKSIIMFHFTEPEKRKLTTKIEN